MEQERPSNEQYTLLSDLQHGKVIQLVVSDGWFYCLTSRGEVFFKTNESFQGSPDHSWILMSAQFYKRNY